MSRKIALMDVGLAFTPAEFAKIFKESAYDIVYLGNVSHAKELKNLITYGNHEFVAYDDIYNYKANESCPRDFDVVKIINDIVNNKLTLDLYDRCFGINLFNYATRSEPKLVEMIIGFYKFLRDKRPSLFVLYECPHHIRSWVMCKVCEAIDIPVYYCRNHITHWRNVMLKGLGMDARVLNEPPFSEPSKHFEEGMFSEIAARYSHGVDAIKPEFQEVMKANKTKKLYSLSHELRREWRRLDKVIYKHMVYKTYSKLCYHGELPKKFAVFFLHLQPERTTLPEGYDFSSQYKAIKILQETLPTDCQILVKEHPATFYTKCNPFGRWLSFYKEIASIPRVKLVPLETDPYMLIENSWCTTTICGTVTGEALIMGKPVITFGLNPIMSEVQPIGLYNFSDIKSLDAFIASIDKLKPDEVSRNYIDIVKRNILNTGISGINSVDQWCNSLQSHIDAYHRSRLALIKALLSQ